MRAENFGFRAGMRLFVKKIGIPVRRFLNGSKTGRNGDFFVK
jgi:hypothetical protein